MAECVTNGRPKSCDEGLHGYGAGRWYFSREEIEECSPSRRDGIDLKRETSLRKSYSTFLQDLGVTLRVPQVTIATAVVLCHRFFLRQSHAKNDRRTIATVCMFLAGKVEETPRPLKDVILASYDIIHKKGPFNAQKMNKEVYEQQKALILLAEKLVLATLGFDLNVHHPYRHLVEAIKKFNVAKNALAKVAWNFVNDGLRTSLSLQFKPQQIAAGAIFLAAKFIKVKLPSHGDTAWWQAFNVTPRQLEDISNQLLELYEQNRTAQQYHGHETGGSSFAATNRRPTGTTTCHVSKSCIWNYNTDRGAKIRSYREPELVSRRREDRGIAGEVVSSVEKEQKLQNDAAMVGKTRGWPKPLHQLERYPSWATKRRTLTEFVNGNAEKDRREEDGELSSIDDHYCSSRKLQSCNPRVSAAAKRKPDEVWSDHSGRDLKRVR